MDERARIGGKRKSCYMADYDQGMFYFHEHLFQRYAARSILPGIFIAPLYFATVRREIVTPSPLSIFVISSSESGCKASSASMSAFMRALIAESDTDLPSSVFVPPEVKNFRISTTPNGVAMYLSRTVRDTVVATTPT